MKAYDPRDEHKIDVQTTEAQQTIRDAKKAYLAFVSRFMHQFDFAEPEKIPAIFAVAQEEGILEYAKAVRRLFFGNDMHFYGVSYLWDHCIERCIYCPAAIGNRAGKYRPRQLTVEEALEDTRAVMTDGHRCICYLTGEDPTHHGARVLSRYLEAIDKLELDEIILNIDAKTIQDLKILRDAVKWTPLQFRVFQETYARDTYEQMHPLSRGTKPDYDFRRTSQQRALEAGFDNVGLGVLFGLHRYPLEEIEGLRTHAEELEQYFGKIPARVCLPSANFLENIGVTIPFVLDRGLYGKDEELVQLGYYEMASEIIYAIAKLAMPTLCLVSSERDPRGLLKRLDYYASCTTLNVHPGVGDNGKYRKSETNQELHFEQATSFSRNPTATVAEMKQRGFNPIISLG